MNDQSINLSPEEHLLLSLSRMQFSDEQRSETGEYLQQVADWDYFVRLANGQGVIALCRYNLTELGYSDRIPPHCLEILNIGYLASLARNTRIFNLLDHVLELSGEEIKIVLLKGLALEKTIYGEKGLRQMNDLDILVERERAIDLRNKLLRHGFVSQPMISPLHEKLLPSYGKHLPEMYKNGFSVEIHYKLFDQTGNSLTESFIERSQYLKNDNLRVTIPEPQLHFLYLVKHLEKHEAGGSSQVRLYTDLVIMLSEYREEILKESLVDYACEAGLEKALSGKLFILGKFWGINDLQSYIDLPASSDREELIKKFIHFLRHHDDIIIEGNQESLLKPMKEMEGSRNKLLFIVGYIFPSVKFMKYRYRAGSAMTAFLYYPVRWMKLMKLILTGSL